MVLDPHRAQPQKSTCPTCGTRFSPEKSAAMPFCSPRCQQIDLGRWLSEEIGLPVEPDEGEEEVGEGFMN
jgi:endogenous inhibitor of DNA gyrase (YacG/DUF329 family)